MIGKLRPSFAFTEDRLRQLQAVVLEAFADGKLYRDILRDTLGKRLHEGSEEHFGLIWSGKCEARRLVTYTNRALV